MLYRLGQVIFWLSTVLAAIFCGIAGLMLFTSASPHILELILFVILAVVLYGFGRAVRHALSGY